MGIALDYEAKAAQAASHNWQRTTDD